MDIAARSSANPPRSQNSSRVVGRPLTVRSALSNDPLMLRNVDGRSLEARRYRDLVIDFVSDLGGPDQASEADKALARQAAGAVVASELLQAAIIAGSIVNLEQATRLQNAAARFLKALRARHRPHKPKATLADYLAARPKERDA